MATLEAAQPDKSLADTYKEICQNIRVTDEISFKLLGTVPLAAGVGSGILTVLEKGKVLEDYAGLAVITLSVLGALITFGLFNWELRNIQRCKWLIARAATLERHLCSDDSLRLQFNGMASKNDLAATDLDEISLSSIFQLPWGKTQAEKLIYSAAIAMWFVPILVALRRLVP